MTTPPGEMSEQELLDRARNAMRRAAALPPGSLARSIQWAVYDRYAGELRRRAIAVVARVARDGR